MLRHIKLLEGQEHFAVTEVKYELVICGKNFTVTEVKYELVIYVVKT